MIVQEKEQRRQDQKIKEIAQEKHRIEGYLLPD